MSDHPHAHGDDRLIAILRREIIDAGVATSAALGVFCDGEEATAEVLARDVEPHALFDLASLTKPLTAISLLRAVADGRLALTTRVDEVLGEAQGTAVASRTIAELLAHRGGLPPWGALYRRDPWAAKVPASLAPDEEPSMDAIIKRAASSATSTTDEVYSDVGYVLLGAIAERVGAERLLSHETVIARMPPTEIVEWRGVVRGEVHDENAAMIVRAGGRPGHAGAFATVDTMMRLARRVLDTLRDRDFLLPPPLARAMITKIPGGTHVLGWDLCSGSAPSSGSYFGPRTFGHLGFTGTSVWIDPDDEKLVVLLTNRTFPTRDNVAIRAARPRVHDAAITAIRRSSS